MPPPSTPCIRVCVLDGSACRGCGRTLDEIGRWGRMSEAERLAIMAGLPARLAAAAAWTAASPPGAAKGERP